MIFLIILLILAGIGCLIRGFWEPYQLTLSTITIYSEKIQKNFYGTKIIQISDLHSSSFGNRNIKLVEMVIKEKPDYILATGDFIDRQKLSYQSFIDFLDGINNICPVIFSLGNHETWVRDTSSDIIDKFFSELSKRNVFILDNSSIEITNGDDRIKIYGFSPMRSIGYKTVKITSEMVFSALGDPDQNALNILMAHEPQFFDAYVNWGADIILSGHVHGGIIRFPFLKGIVSSDSGLLPKYDAGMYFKNKSTMFISRGIGCSHINFRFLNKPEVVKIILTKK